MELHLPELRVDASLADTPASLLWLHATNPTIFSPLTLAHGGMSRLGFARPDEHVAASYRTIAPYLDGAMGLQDEIHIDSENVGSQFNYEFDREGRLTDYSDRPVSDHMRRVIDALQNLVFERGATIRGTNRDRGTDCDFISNGQMWVPRESAEGREIHTSFHPASVRPELGQYPIGELPPRT